MTFASGARVPSVARFAKRRAEGVLSATEGTLAGEAYVTAQHPPLAHL